MRLQQTALFYHQLLQMNRSGHILSTAPDLNNGAGLEVRLASSGTLAIH